MTNLSFDGLSIDGAHDAGASILRLRWRGKSRDRRPQRVIGPFLSEAIAEAARERLSLEMRFEELEYFNSATVMTLVAVIHEARTRKVPLRIVFDAAADWQRLSFEPMRVLAKDGLLDLAPTGGRS